MNRYYKHWRFARIPRGPVLDVGSGSSPFWRANVLMERYLEDDSQRPGKLIVDRPMVCGDIHEIPFVSNAFEFINCSHILEHLAKPEVAIAELTRVAGAGYIETPSEIHEYLDLNFLFHRWAVSLEGGVLTFREKDEELATHPLTSTLRNSTNATRRFLEEHHENVNILSVFWTRDVPYRVERSGRLVREYAMASEPTVASTFAVNEGRRKLKRLLGWMFSPPVDIYAILACPLCKQKVRKVAEVAVACHTCRKQYPIVDGIPRMTREHSSSF